MNSVRAQWFAVFHWLRKITDGKFVFRWGCFKLAAHRGNDYFVLITIPVDKARQDTSSTHDKSKKHLHCLALSQHDSERPRATCSARLMLRSQFRAHELHSHINPEQAWSSDFEYLNVYLFSWSSDPGLRPNPILANRLEAPFLQKNMGVGAAYRVISTPSWQTAPTEYVPLQKDGRKKTKKKREVQSP
jgi:hypothetical protein